MEDAKVVRGPFWDFLGNDYPGLWKNSWESVEGRRITGQHYELFGWR